MTTEPPDKPEGDETEVIFRRWRYDTRTNTWHDARRYGFRAWPIKVPKGRVPKNRKRKPDDPPAGPKDDKNSKDD